MSVPADNTGMGAPNISLSSFSVSQQNGRYFVHANLAYEDDASCRAEVIDRDFASAEDASCFLRSKGFCHATAGYVDAMANPPVTAALAKPKKTAAPKGMPRAYRENAAAVFALKADDPKLYTMTRDLQRDLDILQKKGRITSTLGPTGVDRSFGPLTKAAFQEAERLVRQTKPNAKPSEVLEEIRKLAIAAADRK